MSEFTSSHSNNNPITPSCPLSAPIRGCSTVIVLHVGVNVFSLKEELDDSLLPHLSGKLERCSTFVWNVGVNLFFFPKQQLYSPRLSILSPNESGIQPSRPTTLGLISSRSSSSLTIPSYPISAADKSGVWPIFLVYYG